MTAGWRHEARSWISQPLICSISSHWLRPYSVWSESVRHWYGASPLIGYDLTQYDLNQSGIDMEHLLSLATTLLSMIWISQALIWSISSHWVIGYDLTQHDLNQSGIDMEHLLSLATTLLSMIWISQALICSISFHWLRPYSVWSESARHWYVASPLIGYDLT